MRSNTKFITLILSMAVLLAACGSSSKDVSTEAGPPSSDTTSLSQNTSTDSSDQPDTGDHPADKSQKDEYLQKLSEMEEADRNEEAKTTMAELEQQESDRFEKWDKELNQIYGILKEQLSTEQMEQLREEQRAWIKQRDESAKEASLKYKGGSTEKLEYVATQATLTRERCYELAAQYMK